MGDYNWDALGLRPSNRTLADIISPDVRPSDSKLFVDDVDGVMPQPSGLAIETDVNCIMEVKNEDGSLLGAILIRGNGTMVRGPVGNHGVSIFTADELRNG